MDQGERVARGLDAGGGSAREAVAGGRQQSHQALGLDREREDSEDQQRGDQGGEGLGGEPLRDRLEVDVLEYPDECGRRDRERC